MLSISRIKSAGRAADYYGRDDYYVTGEADSPGLEWGGKGAEKLGVSGTATSAEFKRVLAGENPKPDGPPLSRGDGKHQPGWDLTFSAPKSVSVAILVGGDKALDQAHNASVQKAMDYVERNLAATRVREGGERREVQTGNLLYLSTIHGTSREGDPQRHTHVIVANTTQEPKSGEWRALETRHLYKHQVLVGKIYRAELAKEAKELGYDVRRDETNGTFELDNWTKEQLRTFSKRSETIQAAFEAEKQAKGSALSGAQKDRLVLRDRPDKIESPRHQLVERWKHEAEKAGVDAVAALSSARERGQGRDVTPQTSGKVSEAWSQVQAAVGRLTGHAALGAKDPYGYQAGDTNRDREARAAVSLAIQVSEIRSAVFTRHEVLERALDISRLGVTADRLEREMTRLEKDGRLVKADTTIMGGVTTAYALAVERDILARMEAGRGAGRAVLSPVEASRRLSPEGLREGGATVDLNEGQRSAVAVILTTKDRYSAVQGYAGVGKTTMFGVASQVAKEQGVELQAITPTHKAAEAMQKEAGIYARTVTSWLNNVERALEKGGKAEAKLKTDWEGKRLLVDEASMISNAQMQAIVRAADRIGIAGVTFIGDQRQLPSPNAGAPFRLLLNESIEQAQVTENIRQRNAPTLKESVEHLAMGRPGAALAAIKEHILEVGKGADDRALAKAGVEAWKAYDAAGETARIVVVTNAMRGLTAAVMREEMKSRGVLAPEGEVRERYYQHRVEGPLRFRADSYQLDQVAAFHSGNKAAGIRKGEELRIGGIDSRNETLRLESANGATHTLALRPLARRGEMPFEAYNVREVEISTGERMVWERADAKRGFFTGAGFTVEAQARDAWTIRHENGKVEQLSPNDPALKFSGYGYSETADRAQGQTYKNTVGVMSSRDGEAATIARQYVMGSRPSVDYTLVTNDRALLLMKLAQQDGMSPIALENIAKSLDEVERSQPKPDSSKEPDQKAKSKDRDTALASDQQSKDRDEPLFEKTPDQPIHAIPDRSL